MLLIRKASLVGRTHPRGSTSENSISLGRHEWGSFLLSWITAMPRHYCAFLDVCNAAQEISHATTYSKNLIKLLAEVEACFDNGLKDRVDWISVLINHVKRLAPSGRTDKTWANNETSCKVSPTRSVPLSANIHIYHSRTTLCYTVENSDLRTFNVSIYDHSSVRLSRCSIANPIS